ncbi:MAG TPA: tetratricopeptide repeat protein [Gammaproteobacteria bacterium]|nr:tetratricopeptide repeat protein [Gammaproteobacteria bacterium]
MTYARWTFLAASSALLCACAGNPDRRTLAGLHDVEADVAAMAVDDSLDRAMDSYRRYLAETPETTMTPEALRRLADLQIEKEYGLIGDGTLIEIEAPPDGSLMTARAARSVQPGTELARPEAARAEPAASVQLAPGARDAVDPGESDLEFEARATGELVLAPAADLAALELPDSSVDATLAGPLEAIAIYKRILEEYPTYERIDQVLYQLARAYDEIGQPEEAMAVMEQITERYPYTRYLDEVNFRRGEFLFTRRQYRPAEEAYAAIIDMGTGSSYYELALYKLGWTLYKQEFYEEALHQYMALLDYKLSIGYDFDAANAEEDERRVADTYRVISLSFSNLGGPEVADVVEEYFTLYGNRSYEDRIYANLGEFYLSKLRYQDAAEVYKSFVDLYPFHRAAPRFSMRVADVYAEGNFPLLVVEAKKDFAMRYGLASEYWQHFDTSESPDVLEYLKSNLKDLANHYHALYQQAALVDERPANFGEASLWYREFLASFPDDAESPAINYQLADLLLENEDFVVAATEYERTAYDYAPHEQASAAGYAAVFAHRENLRVVPEAGKPEAMRATVDSSLRFADTFPDHEHAPVVLGAAADDLYALEDYETAIVSAQKLIDRYPASEPALRRSAWIVVAHSSFELAAFANAERAYTRVLELTRADDESHRGLVENLAASIYKQGEAANELEDYRAAAEHFLRVKSAAPTSEIRPAAEYDAAAALIRLEDWPMAAGVLEGFRDAFPEHELQNDVTKQLASVYRRGGQLDRSAAEYERVAAEASDPELKREAMLLAAELYEEASSIDSALDVYERYVVEFPEPLDVAQETRFKVAEIYESKADIVRYHETLQRLIDVDAVAGAARTDRSRYLAAQSALVLSQQVFERFVEVRLVQPFEQSLEEKRRRMDTALETFEGLVDYQVGDVTAAATFYIAEIYYEFSQSLLGSERPADLSAAERAEYELAIEEEAFPFEEQAIEVHEANFELITAGVYNEWVRKSLEKLGVLMPGRYAKHEISTGFLGSIDTYAYRAPAAIDLDIAPVVEQTSTARAAPGDAAGDDAVATEELTSALAR